ncbi:MAG: hypothetical protein V7609_3339 [Verrucomicrobiota bacterium]
MSHLLDMVVEFLGYILSWRAWVCLILGVIIAYFLAVSGVALLLGGILGLGIGLFWEARVG